jgi:hypothetical protein
MADFTPDQWRDYLLRIMLERWQQGPWRGQVRSRPWRILDDYYEGRHPMQFATPKFQEAFGALFAAFADNWIPTVIDAPVERLHVQGFRFGQTSDADDDAWSMWQANGLDSAVEQLHTEAIKLGEAYWLVDPPAEGDTWPRITAEHPLQTIVECDKGDRTRRLAAVKTWQARDGRTLCTLWLPDMIYRWERYAATLSTGIVLPPMLGAWQPRTDAPAREENTLGVVPVIPVRNRPGMLSGGRSDSEPVLGLQDAINKLGSDGMVGSEFTAWPQRVLTGVAQPKDPDTGRPVPRSQLEAGASRLLLFSNAAAKTQEWAAANPAALVPLIEMYVQHFAAQSRTPPHYLLGQIVNVAASALKAAETGLVARTKGKWPDFGESHEEMIRVGFLAVGDQEKANRMDAETIWGDPETRSEAETFDAAVKGLAVGLPERVVWERIGLSPTEINRAQAEKAADALLNPTADAAVASAAEGRLAKLTALSQTDQGATEPPADQAA